MKHPSPVGQRGHTMMERPPTPKTPVEHRYAFDLDDVTPRPAARQPPAATADLSPEDRLALGLTAPPRIAHNAPEIHGDAAAALRDVLVKGGALGKTQPRRK